MVTKNTTILFAILLFTLSCVSQKKLETSNGVNKLFPYMEGESWGYTNEDGAIVIKPQFDSVDFFNHGLAVVEQDGKYGYLNQSGEWHIKPKYDKATKFYKNGATVTKGRRSYYIDQSGRKTKSHPTTIYGMCGNGIRGQLDPMEYIVQKNGSYELLFKYWLVTDFENEKEIIDTTNIAIDSFFGYSHNAIVLKKNGKYAIYKCFPVPSKVIVASQINANKSIDKSYKHDQIQFLYDAVEYDNMGIVNTYNDEVKLAKVRVGERWGVVNGEGEIVVPIAYNSIDISNNSLALVEFEKNKKGYRQYDSKDSWNGKITEGSEFFISQDPN